MMCTIETKVLHHFFTLFPQSSVPVHFFLSPWARISIQKLWIFLLNTKSESFLSLNFVCCVSLNMKSLFQNRKSFSFISISFLLNTFFTLCQTCRLVSEKRGWKFQWFLCTFRHNLVVKRKRNREKWKSSLINLKMLFWWDSTILLSSLLCPSQFLLVVACHSSNSYFLTEMDESKFQRYCWIHNFISSNECIKINKFSIFPSRFWFSLSHCNSNSQFPPETLFFLYKQKHQLDIEREICLFRFSNQLTTLIYFRNPNSIVRHHHHPTLTYNLISYFINFCSVLHVAKSS